MIRATTTARVIVGLVLGGAVLGLASCGDTLVVPAPPAGSIRDADLAAVIGAAEAAARARPQDAAVWMRLGMVLDANGFFAEAAVAYRRVTELRPADAQVWYHLAIVLERENRFDDALAAATQVVKLAPDYPPMPRNVAMWFLARGRIQDAEVHARRAVELSRGSSAALLVLGRVLLEQGRDVEAAEVLDGAVTAWPPAWGDASYARFLCATARRRAGTSADAANPRDLRGSVEPPSLPDPWRAELVPLRAGNAARRRAATGVTVTPR